MRLVQTRHSGFRVLGRYSVSGIAGFNDRRGEARMGVKTAAEPYLCARLSIHP